MPRPSGSRNSARGQLHCLRVFGDFFGSFFGQVRVQLCVATPPRPKQLSQSQPGATLTVKELPFAHFAFHLQICPFQADPTRSFQQWERPQSLCERFLLPVGPGQVNSLGHFFGNIFACPGLACNLIAPEPFRLLDFPKQSTVPGAPPKPSGGLEHKINFCCPRHWGCNFGIGHLGKTGRHLSPSYPPAPKVKPLFQSAYFWNKLGLF